MRNSQTSHPVLRIMRDVLFVDIVIVLLISIIYFLAGWNTTHQFGNGLVWAGIIGMIFLLVSAGWRDGRRQDFVALSQMMREHEAFYLLNRENSGRARFLLVGLFALIISLAIGVILLNVP